MVTNKAWVLSKREALLPKPLVRGDPLGIVDVGGGGDAASGERRVDPPGVVRSQLLRCANSLR